MAWPPPVLPVNRTDALDQQANHPADHNAVNQAVNDTVGQLVTTAAQATATAAVISATPSGSPNVDFIDIDTSPHKSVVRFADNQSFHVLQPSPSTLGSVFTAATDGSVGLFVGDSAHSYQSVGYSILATGSQTPAWYLDVGSRQAAVPVRLRFINIESIVASVPWPVASDEHLKHSIVDVGDVDIDALRVVRYVRRDDPDHTERIGFIAQELADTLPEAAVTDDAGEPVAYLNEVVTAVLVRAVQQLTARVAALESANP